MKHWTDEQVERYRNNELNDILASLTKDELLEYPEIRDAAMKCFDQQITDTLNDAFKDAESEEFDQNHLP